MKFKTETKRIGPHKYHVTQLDAVRGSNALLRLGKIAGPVFEVGAKDGEGAAFAKLASTLTEDDFRWFCDLFAGQTTVSGGAYDEDAEPALDNIFSEHFAGEYFEMLEWFRFCLEVNFQSFFVRALAKLTAAKAKAEASSTASTSPKTSTGDSGA